MHVLTKFDISNRSGILLPKIQSRLQTHRSMIIKQGNNSFLAALIMPLPYIHTYIHANLDKYTCMHHLSLSLYLSLNVVKMPSSVNMKSEMEGCFCHSRLKRNLCSNKLGPPPTNAPFPPNQNTHKHILRHAIIQSQTNVNC